MGLMLRLRLVLVKWIREMMLSNGVYFVSGIDTDAGKSYATALVAKSLLEQGKSVMTQKFIQTGGVGEKGVSIDIELHRRVMGMPILDEDISGFTSPVIFSYPASPHLASKIDGVEIDFSLIEKSTRELSQRYDILLVEGAGGLHVPLKEFYTTIDYIQDHNLPVIFVTSGKLGSINHTILSLEACAARGLKVPLLVYNRFFRGDDGVIDDDTFNYICSYVAKFWPETEIFEIEDCDL